MSSINLHQRLTFVGLGAAAMLTAGVTQIVHSQRGTGDRVVGTAGHVALSGLIVALLCMPALFLTLRAYAAGRFARHGALIASAGTFVLGATCIASLVRGKDPGIFVVVAPITNAAWLLGSIALSVGLRRAGRLPAVVTYSLPVMWLTSIIGATLGGGVLSAVYIVASTRALATTAMPAAPREAAAT